MADLSVDWAAQCGMAWAGKPRPVFTHPSQAAPLDFNFYDADSARAALMLAGACMDPNAESPCLDGMDSLDWRWQEPVFRDAMLLHKGSPDAIALCLWHLHEHYRPGRGFEGVREVAADYFKEKEAEAQARAEAARQASRKEQDARIRREIERREYREWQERERLLDRQMRAEPKESGKEWSEELQRWIVPAHGPP